jgi:hypothetical protein
VEHALSPSTFTIAVTESLRKIANQEPDIAHLTAALRHLAKWRAELITNTIAGKSGTVVQTGPFQGMNYGIKASEGSGSARLLGVYEASLAPIIETIITRAYPLVVDIGSAEGYYAVGLARRMPGSRVMARDANPSAQDRCGRLAVLNGVQGRVEIGGIMTHADLEICRAQKTLVLCDIEGAEAELLDPVAAPGLTRADILVECHDGMQPGLSALLAARFAPTHHVTRIDRALNATLPGWMEELSDLDRLIALWEWRAGPTPWLWMQVK